MARYEKFTTIDETLVCALCLGDFVDPRALPCLHTFCNKCLVPLIASQKKQENFLESLINLRGAGNSLKCPVCLEKHPIPEEGFRKDFRVAKLVQQQTEKLEAEAKSRIEKCLVHPEEKLLYHCEEPSCKNDICEICWSSEHNKHLVVLLSRKVGDAKGVLREEIENALTKISSTIEFFSDMKETSIKNFEDVKLELEERYSDIQLSLEKALDRSSSYLDSLRQQQQDNFENKLKELRELQTFFERYQKDLENDDPAQTIGTFNIYQLSYGQLKPIVTKLSQQDFSFVEADLEIPLTADCFKKPFNVTYSHRPLTVDTEKTGNEETETLFGLNREIDEDAKETENNATKHAKEREEDTEAEEGEEETGDDADETGEDAEETGDRGSDAANELIWEEGEDESKSSDKKRSTEDRLTEKSENDDSELDKSTPPERPDVSANNLTQPKTNPTNFSKMNLETSFRANGEVKGLAASVDGSLYVSTEKNLSRYHVGETIKTISETSSGTGAIVTVVSKETSEEYLAQINAKSRIITIYSEQNTAFVYPVEKNSLELLGSLDNLLAYIYYDDKQKLYVNCLSIVENPRVTKLHTAQLTPYLESKEIASICLCKSMKGNPTLVWASDFVFGKTKRTENAVSVLVLSKVPSLTRISFNQLDSEAADFNLCGITCDNKNIFLLNSWENTMYHITKAGLSVRKVVVSGACFPFSFAKNICLQPQYKTLYVSSDDDLISKYVFGQIE